ncbi:DUF4279 domain-containing protein [Trabulsiella odontotermitis]|uniref:DUF4279 domain-containing protein n=1 Tax=Trabulsiella odontotermitis TaxID=379893 RepID=UPI000675C4E1|nr:DUF4279 domain-containing protein [Trabulsiella odontotermitis]KNC92566.1 hypothetical protein GM30_15805 [Trabulsiella odontotermitis]
MTKTTVKAEFSICGNGFEPSEITNMLGISPTEIILEGVISGSRKRPSTETSWSVSTDKEQSYDVDIQIQSILSLLKDKVIILREMKEKYKVNFYLMLLIEVEDGEKPAIYWTAETNRFLGKIEAESSVELYVYS